jgi:hypothetical protein
MEKVMKTKSRARTLRALKRTRFDADLAENTDQVSAVEQISATAERSASTIDDAVNGAEASEERFAAYEAQAMR